MTIYIGNLDYQVTEDDLRDVFNDYGSVRKVTIPRDRETGRVRGFAFVEMETDEEETNAIEELNGATWMNRELRVNKARPKEKRNSRPKNFNNRY